MPEIPPLPPEDPREYPEVHTKAPPCALVAVDIGLRTGLAGFSRLGRPLWQRSQHLASRDALKRFVRGLLYELPDLEALAIEGGGRLAEIWMHAAEKRGLRLLSFVAEQWRRELLLPRQQRSGLTAKDAAVQLAREELAAAGIAVAGNLRHDAAEAVLLGVHAAGELGWR